MKILFLGQFAPPYHGVTQMNEYALLALRREFDVLSVNLAFSASIRQVSRFGFWKLFKTIYLLARILQLLIVKDFKVVYYTLCPTGIAFFRDCLIILVIKLFRVDLIYHLHGQGIRKNSRKWCFDHLYRFVFRNSTVIHLSEIFYDEVKRYVEKKDFIAINNCVFLGEKSSKSEVISVGTPVRFIFLSNLMIGKGFLQYLEAISDLFARGYNFSATLVGDFYDDNAEIEYLKWEKYNSSFVDSGLFKKIPAVFGVEKFKIISEHDVFVFPTLIDTYPVVLIEAMACGLACISTNVGAISEILDNGISGLIVEKNSHEQLVDAMIHFVDDEIILRKYKNKSLLKYKNDFTLDKFSNNLCNVVLRRVNS